MKGTFILIGAPATTTEEALRATLLDAIAKGELKSLLVEVIEEDLSPRIDISRLGLDLTTLPDVKDNRLKGSRERKPKRFSPPPIVEKKAKRRLR